MNDKELLELAAKAAGKYAPKKDCPNGWEGIRSEKWGCFTMGGEGRTPDYQWNPLTDDGDALRLAVKLGLDLSFEGDNVVFANGTCSEFLRSDYCAATRRAIVRAAAEIGKAMP